MKRFLGMVGLLLVALGGVQASAAEREGSIPEDLAARKPPPPNDVYVATIPFWTTDERQRETARACVMMNLLRHGFRLAPSGAKSLAASARRTDAAIRRDPKTEPLARPEPADLARWGKSLGAQWVVYGEIGELHTRSEGNALMPRKEGVIDVRLVLVDAESAEVIYWARVTDTMSGSSGPLRAKATSIERTILTRTINDIFDDIGKALPEHYSSGPVSPEMVRQVVESLGQ